MRKRDERPDEQRVLEELILAELRDAVDLDRLLDFEANLDGSVRRALDGRPDDARGAVSADYFRRAWTKLTNEVMAEVAARRLLEAEECGLCALEQLPGPRGQA